MLCGCDLIVSRFPGSRSLSPDRSAAAVCRIELKAGSGSGSGKSATNNSRSLFIRLNWNFRRVRSGACAPLGMVNFEQLVKHGAHDVAARCNYVRERSFTVHFAAKRKQRRRQDAHNLSPFSLVSVPFFAERFRTARPQTRYSRISTCVTSNYGRRAIG